MNITVDDIKAHILWKLHIKRVYGGKHTALETVTKSIPKHLVNEYLRTTKELIKKGLIVTKPTNYGLQISLNVRRTNEIVRIVTIFATKYKKFLL